MYATKSFCNILALANTEPGIDSPFGELSLHAATFSRDPAAYHSNAIDGYDLVNFSSKVDGASIRMKRSAIEQAIGFVDTATRMTMGTSGELHQDEVHRALVQTAEQINAHTVQTGRMVTDGVRWLPSWVSWVDNGDNAENEHIVWLAINDFTAEYPEYEMIVVPPVDDLDSFFFPGTLVENFVRAITPTQMMERAENAKGAHPTTWRRSDAYAYHDPMNSSRVFDVYWQVLGYGDAGNDPDLIRDMLMSYILDNSERTRDEWATIFPDIFKRTEFVFTPAWNRYAADARVFDHGIYSPVFKNGDAQKYATIGAVDYPAAHIATNSQGFPFLYRSLMVFSIGHQENKDGKVLLGDHYPDYMAVPTSSTDYGRMSPATQAWVEKMNELIVLAEGWTSATRLPKGIYRVKRGAHTYVSANVNRVLMLVLVKSSFPTTP